MATSRRFKPQEEVEAPLPLTPEQKAYAIWLGVRMGRHVAESDSSEQMDLWKDWSMETLGIMGLDWTGAGNGREAQIKYLIDTLNDVLLGDQQHVELVRDRPHKYGSR